MKIRHVALATDFSGAAEIAVAQAIELANRFDARLTAVHVDELGALALYRTLETASFFDRLQGELQQRLERLRQTLSLRGVAAEAIVLDGTPWRAILQHAVEHQVDLIVLGKHGVRELDRHLIGSTTRNIIRHAKIPILVVPTSAGPREGVDTESAYRIAFSTDFSRDSARGLTVCAELADALAAELRVQHVLKVPTLIPAAPPALSHTVPSALTDRVAQAAEVELRAALETIAPGRADRVSSRLIVGTGVAQALVGQEQEIDLHVIASHGKGAVEATLLGSSSERLIRLTARPVWLLRRGYLDARFGSPSRN